jgi:hypothetical protein
MGKTPGSRSSSRPLLLPIEKHEIIDGIFRCWYTRLSTTRARARSADNLA